MGDGLIPVEKAGEVLWVHPTCLDEHLRLGWRVCDARPDPEPATEIEPKPETKQRKARSA